ncbi:MAG TPA: tetratricopeptide repeat protein [Polyangiaceae bacterium]|nr:tetratricopeptide repeat protein [Polyangiaceae bacterium]
MVSSLADQGLPEAERLLADALAHHRAGRYSEAEATYGKALSADPASHRALYSWSVLSLQLRHDQRAADLLTRAIELAPENHVYHSNLGEALRRLGRVREAALAVLRAVSLDREFAEGFYNLGVLLKSNGEHTGAALNFQRAVDLRPDTFVFQLALARSLERLGQLELAAGHCCAALALKPDATEACDVSAAVLLALGRGEAAAAIRGGDVNRAGKAALRRGLELNALGQAEAALPYFERSAFSVPREPGVHLPLARLLRSLGEHERCVPAYHAAIAVEPTAVEALVELSSVLKELGRSDGALVAARRAVGLAPDSAAAHANMGAALVDFRRNEEAAAACRAAIAMDASSALAHFQLGNALVGLGAVEQAIESYRRSLALEPHQPIAHANLLLTMSYSPEYDTHAIAREARRWASRHADPLAVERRPHVNIRDPERRLRIGYVSPDFYRHPVSVFMLPLLEHHDRAAVEVYCYSSVQFPDAITDRVERAADVFRNVAGVSDRGVAERVRADCVDILVDLTMHAGNGRLRAFARKPAPLQVCWLAYPGTTGLDAIDYRLTDPYLDPPDVDAGVYAERTLALPDTFWCYAPLEATPDVGMLPARRNGHVTFGCLHSFHKVNGPLLVLWGRLLDLVAESRLQLHVPADATARAVSALEAAGIDTRRVDLTPRKQHAEYMSAYGSIDVCLDTAPFNGATTSLDALWMGVPVVTLVGATPVGRAGLSIMSNLGLQELSARSPDDYVRVAAELAADLDRLEALRRDLRARLLGSALMDAPRFARNMESAYRTAWRRWCSACEE